MTSNLCAHGCMSKKRQWSQSCRWHRCTALPAPHEVRQKVPRHCHGIMRSLMFGVPEHNGIMQDPRWSCVDAQSFIEEHAPPSDFDHVLSQHRTGFCIAQGCEASQALHPLKYWRLCWQRDSSKVGGGGKGLAIRYKNVRRQT